MLLRKFILLFVSLMQLQNVHAQQANNYEYFGVENGLTSNLVKCFLQDKRGLIWIGTPNGLIRFDGKTFLNINNLPGCNFLSVTVTDLSQLNDSLILVATSAGVNVLNIHTFTTRKLSVLNEVPIETPTDIKMLKCRDGSLYFVIKNDYIVRMNSKLDKAELIGVKGRKGKQFQRLNYLSEDANGMLWAVTFEGEIFTMTTSGQSFELRTKLDINLRALVQTQKHGFIITSLNGIYTFDPNSNETERIYNEVESCSLIYEDDLGDVWINYEYERLFKISANGGEEQTARIKLADIYNYQINAVYKDPQQNMWIGTNFGLVKYNVAPQKFKSHFQANSKLIDKLNTSTRVITEDTKTNELYFAAYSGVFRLNKARTKVDSIWLDKDYPFIPYAVVCDNNKLWIGTEGNGLYSYDVKKRERKRYYMLSKQIDETPEPLFIRFMIKLPDGNLLICEYDNLILFDTKTDKARVIKNNLYGKTNEAIRIIHGILSVDGNYWMAGPDGIYVINQQAELIDHITKFNGLTGEQFKCVEEQDETFIWFGSENEGLLKYNRKTGASTHYSTNDGLVNNGINGILRAKNKNLWISTQNGLAFFNSQNNAFVNFKIEDGIVTNEFNTSSFYRSTDRNLYFGSVNGIIAIADTFVPKQIHSSNLVWTKVHIHNPEYENIYNWMDDGGKLYIPYYNSFFELNFALTNYVNANRNSYYYRIENLVDQWQPLGNLNILRFNELPPGNYYLQVKAYGNNNNASSKILTLNFVVGQAYYKSWWFISLIIVALLGIAYIIIYTRLKQLQRIADLRMTISSDLHDDVGSVLTRIAMQADFATRQKDKGVTDVLSGIAESSRSAISNMRDVIWATDVRNDKLENLVDRMREQAEVMLTDAGIQYNLNVKISSDVIIKLNVRQHLYLIYKEALNNIVKHANATHVIIDLFDSNNTLHLHIQDNGVPAEKKMSTGGSGIANMRLRARKLGASIDISTYKGYAIHVSLKSYKQNKFWKNLVWKN